MFLPQLRFATPADPAVDHSVPPPRRGRSWHSPTTHARRAPVRTATSPARQYVPPRDRFVSIMRPHSRLVIVLGNLLPPHSVTLRSHRTAVR